MNTIKTVHVIFKTHLDVGFTDLAENVINQYMEQYIPKALQLAEDLQRNDGSAQFVWTTGSWLINEYLKKASKEQIRKMENAITAGRIAWHGLPFTTHTELVDPRLFEYGLSIAQKLNARFGKSTITAKMTDVPGHTIGMVPLLAKYGIRYLHLGVNPASKVPSVPEIFVWRAQDGSEVIVNYASNYGNIVQIEGCEDAMVFAHTGDNCGPPSIEDIQLEFAKLSEKFPGAVIQASTMEAFVSKMLDFKDHFPVVCEEIGDTWIHGAASDPTKIQQYRDLLRLRDKWLTKGRLDPASEEYSNFSDKLLLIPEHTWGMDEKKFLADFKHYSISEFKAARQADVVSKDAIPDKYAYIGSFAMDEGDGLSSELFASEGRKRSFHLFESSFQEKREYLQQAIQCLSADKQLEATEVLRHSTAAKEELTESNSLNLRLRTTYPLGRFEVEFDTDGSICKLVDENGKVWADESHRLGCFEYQTFGSDDYQHWFEHYVVQRSKTYKWADADFGKPGMEFAEPKPENRKFVPSVTRITACLKDDFDLVQVQLSMPTCCVQLHGAPNEICIAYRFNKYQRSIDAELKWFDKQAYRMPEASWFSFVLKTDNPNLWKMDKMGTMISPLEVVKNGNRNLHAVNSGVYYEGSDGSASIQTIDVPLVAPGRKRLLQFDNTFVSLDGGMHFLLHNNVWGTNFPMWFEDDVKFRFVIKLD